MDDTTYHDDPAYCTVKQDGIISKGNLGGSNVVLNRCHELLCSGNKKISLAESCTGGLLAKMITDLPGSSDYFWGSFCTYSNEAKQLLLGVKGSSLEEYGAVSSEVALEMAQGILAHYPVDIAVAITGIAGPGGSSSKKPVGLVYISLAEGDYSLVRKYNFKGKRSDIRLCAAKTALDLLLQRLES